MSAERKRDAKIEAMKEGLGRLLRERRRRLGMTQTELAARLKTSQSRVSRIEAGDPTVSLDLLVRAALATRASRRAIGKAIG